MDVNLDQVAKVLNDSSKFLDELIAKPDKAITRIPEIMDRYQELKNVVDIEKIKRGFPDMDFHQKKMVFEAIDNFLFTKKTVEEKAGAIAGAIFQNQGFIDFTHALKDLSKFLKRGEKVEPPEHEAL